MAKVLNLTLMKRWFDMELGLIKKEEYREIKPYWTKRLCDPVELRMESYITPDFTDADGQGYLFKKFDLIRMTNGYAKNAPTFDIECKGISIGKGCHAWGAPSIEVFVLQLGNIISKSNIN